MPVDAAQRLRVPASTQQEQIFSHVYLYYHGAGAETTYRGPSQIGFFRGATAASGSKTNIIVKKNESITNQSTTGIVTNTPGTYALTIAFDATVDKGKSSTAPGGSECVALSGKFREVIRSSLSR